MEETNSQQDEKLTRLSDLVPLLRELAHDVANRNFEKLIEHSQIEIEDDQTEADSLQYFIDALDSYPFKPIDPPDTEIYRAIGVLGEQLRDQMVNKIPLYGDDYEEYTKEDIDRMIICGDKYPLSTELLLWPDPEEIQTSTYLCLCIDIGISNCSFSIKARYLYVS